MDINPALSATVLNISGLNASVIREIISRIDILSTGTCFRFKDTSISKKKKNGNI